MILTKEKFNLCTSNLQYGFKQGSSVSLSTAMVQDTISYYHSVHNGSNVYGLTLDTRRAFDCKFVNCFTFCFIRKFVLYFVDYSKSLELDGTLTIHNILMYLTVLNRGCHISDFILNLYGWAFK